MSILVYQLTNGSRPFDKWFLQLPAVPAAKVTTATTRMGDGNFGDHKSVGKGVSESRIDFGIGYRIYFGRDGDDVVILLLGGSKKSQSADIALAQSYWADYKKRKAQSKRKT